MRSFKYLKTGIFLLIFSILICNCNYVSSSIFDQLSLVDHCSSNKLHTNTPNEPVSEDCDTCPLSKDKFIKFENFSTYLNFNSLKTISLNTFLLDETQQILVDSKVLHPLYKIKFNC